MKFKDVITENFGEDSNADVVKIAKATLQMSDKVANYFADNSSSPSELASLIIVHLGADKTKKFAKAVKNAGVSNVNRESLRKATTELGAMDRSGKLPT